MEENPSQRNNLKSQKLLEIERISNTLRAQGDPDYIEEITSQEKLLTELRKDEFIPHDKKLIESLKNFREHYVRAPKMN